MRVQKHSSRTSLCLCPFPRYKVIGQWGQLNILSAPQAPSSSLVWPFRVERYTKRTMAGRSVNGFDALPNEMVFLVLGHLRTQRGLYTRSMAVARRVCRLWRGLVRLLGWDPHRGPTVVGRSVQFLIDHAMLDYHPRCHVLCGDPRVSHFCKQTADHIQEWPWSDCVPLVDEPPMPYDLWTSLCQLALFDMGVHPTATLVGDERLPTRWRMRALAERCPLCKRCLVDGCRHQCLRGATPAHATNYLWGADALEWGPNRNGHTNDIGLCKYRNKPWKNIAVTHNAHYQRVWVQWPEITRWSTSVWRLHSTLHDRMLYLARCFQILMDYNRSAPTDIRFYSCASLIRRAHALNDRLTCEDITFYTPCTTYRDDTLTYAEGDPALSVRDPDGSINHWDCSGWSDSRPHCECGIDYSYCNNGVETDPLYHLDVSRPWGYPVAV